MGIDTSQIITKLKQYYKTDDILSGKGGFWIKGHGFISLAKARRLVKVEAPKRPKKPKIQAWGDYATIAMLNQPRKKKS